MKLLLEQWRQYITEAGLDTKWDKDGEPTITLPELQNYLRNNIISLNALELFKQLPSLPIDPDPIEKEKRIDSANLEYPIIVVKHEGRYKYVLDGNHRLQKAIDTGTENIKAGVLDLDDPETPDAFKRMFGGAK